VEQFMRSIVKKGVTRGDELCSEYKLKLPEDFKARFPTLADTYESLSEAMHKALADEALFLAELEKVQKHFRARELFALE